MKKKFLIPIILSLGLSGCNFPGLPGLNHGNNNKEEEKQEDNVLGPLDQSSFDKFINKFNTEGCSYNLEQNTYTNNIYVETLKTVYKIDLLNNEYYAFLTEHHDSGTTEVTRIIQDGYAYQKEGSNGYFHSFKAPADQIAHQLKLEQESNKFLLIPSDNLSDYGYDSERGTYTYKGEFPSPFEGDNSTYTYDMSYSYNLSGRSYIEGSISVYDASDKSTIRLDIAIVGFYVGTPEFDDLNIVKSVANKEFSFDRYSISNCDSDKEQDVIDVCKQFYSSKISFGSNEWEWYLPNYEGGIVTYFGQYSESDGEPKLSMRGYIADGVRYYSPDEIEFELLKDINKEIVISMDMPLGGRDCKVNFLFSYTRDITFQRTEASNDNGNLPDPNNQLAQEFHEFYTSFKDEGCRFLLDERFSVDGEFVASTNTQYTVDFSNGEFIEDARIVNQDGNSTHVYLGIDKGCRFTCNSDDSYNVELIERKAIEETMLALSSRVTRFIPFNNINELTKNDDGSYSFKKTINRNDGSEIISIDYDLTYIFYFEKDNKSMKITGSIETTYKSTGRVEKSEIEVCDLSVDNIDVDIPVVIFIYDTRFICSSFKFDEAYRDAVCGDMTVVEFANLFTSSILSVTYQYFEWQLYTPTGDELVTFIGECYDGVYHEDGEPTSALIIGQESLGRYQQLPDEPTTEIRRTLNNIIIYEFILEDGSNQYPIYFELQLLND